MGNRTAQRALAAHAMDLLQAMRSAAAFDKCQNRIRPFGGVSRFQREQAMNEDIDEAPRDSGYQSASKAPRRGSIRRAPIESAMYRAARSKLKSCSGLLRPERVPVARRRYRRPPLRGGLFMLDAASCRWRYWQEPSLKSRQRTGSLQCWPRGCRGHSRGSCQSSPSTVLSDFAERC